MNKSLDRFGRFKDDLRSMGISDAKIPDILYRAHQLVDEWKGFHFQHISEAAEHTIDVIIHKMRMEHPILSMSVGEMKDWKFGLATRQIERTSPHRFKIHCTTDGWQTATVGPNTLYKVLTGKISLTSLNWS